MLIYTEHLRLRLTSPGQLIPWLGLALRGLVGARFKEKVCRHSPRERRERWVHCTGCPHLAECSYGQTFEPDPPPGVEVFHGQEDAARPLVLAPYFPLPARAERGGEAPLKLLCIGRQAEAHAAEVRAVLTEVGLDSGLGPDRIGFEVLPDPFLQPGLDELSAADLPAHPDALPGRLPRVGVGLTGPLLLKQRDEQNRRQANQRPRFSDLFRAAPAHRGPTVHPSGGGADGGLPRPGRRGRRGAAAGRLLRALPAGPLVEPAGAALPGAWGGGRRRLHPCPAELAAVAALGGPPPRGEPPDRRRRRLAVGSGLIRLALPPVPTQAGTAIRSFEHPANLFWLARLFPKQPLRGTFRGATLDSWSMGKTWLQGNHNSV